MAELTSVEKKELKEFKYGKYRGQFLSECEDVGYLRWYASTSDSLVADEILKGLGFVRKGDKYITKAEFEEFLKSQEEFIELSKKDFFTGSLKMERNFSYEGTHIDFKKDVTYKLQSFKRMIYGDYGYSVPRVGKTGKKIKGKTFQYIGKCTETKNDVTGLSSFEIQIKLITQIDDKKIKPVTVEEKMISMLLL